jgi:hypothetical protein
MKRTLSLKRETLAELTTDDLRDVVGGASGITCPLGDCVRDLSEALGCVGSYNCPTWTC